MKMPAWFHPLAAALLVTPAFASPVRTQTLASADAVPEGLSAPEWSSIRQQYEQQRHAAYPVTGGYQARNPGQQWQTRFDGRGFTVTPKSATAERDRSPVAACTRATEPLEFSELVRPVGPAATGDRSRSGASAPAWQWGLELQSYGFAGQERAVAEQPRVKTSGPRVTYDWDATVQEWFVNARRGLEHGFTVRERPSGAPVGAAGDYGLRRQAKRDAALAVGVGQAKAPSPLRSAGALQDAIAPSLNSQPSTLNFLLAVRGGLRPEVQADGRGVRFVDAQGAAALTYSELTVLDADGRKLPARFEPVEGRAGCPQPAAGDDAAQQTPRRAEDSAPGHDCGLRLAIDERGARYPLTIDPIAQQAYLKASNTDINDEFGYSVAVSGNTVVVGAPFESSSARGVNGNQSNNSATYSGAAYVFVRNGTNWTQQAYLKASNTGGTSPGYNDGDEFGFSVAVSGNTVVVGAPFEFSSATGVNGNQGDNSAVDSGAAYVFVRNGTTWTQQAYLKASNTGAYDGFGSSVAVSGDTVVVGADWEASSATGVNGDQSDNSVSYAGAAYVFVRSGTNWSQQAYLKASNTGSGDDFGWSVAVSGDTVVVGAFGESSSATGVNGDQSDNSAVDSGAAYVFVRSGTTWTQQAYLKASNTGAYDGFGYSVAVSGDTVVVGAYGEDSSATGVNGNQGDNSATNSGAAYVFVRSGTTWSQQAYLKASNTDAYNQFHWAQSFGLSVAVSGDTVVVGARWEWSNATGVNGDQSNIGAPFSGAAYVFVRSGTDWSQQAYLKASNTDVDDEFGISVSVSGGTVVVGADREASNARGVNGNQSNNSADFAGAAYIFTGVGLGPTLAIAPDGSGGYLLGFNGAPEITYRLQRAPSVTGPWSDLVTNTAPASGLIEYHETSPPPGAAFYRTAQP